MATPQQIYYQNHRDAVREYKKAHYAKKSHRQEISLFKTIQLKGKTKGESRKIIKNAIEAGTIAIKYIPPDAQKRFDDWGIPSQTTWTPLVWVENKRSPIRTDQKTIVVNYRENIPYSFREKPQDREVLEITFEPWMLEHVMSYEDE